MHTKLSRSFSIIFLLLLLSSAVIVAFGGQGAFAQTFSVTTSSPTSGSVFNRGQTVTITASVSSGGSPVSGASVTASSPTGGTITLSGTSTTGTYSAQYSILTTDPVGTWTINVQAIKNGQVASRQVSVSVSGGLKVSVLSPVANTKLNIGEMAAVAGTVTFQDNSPIPTSAFVTFNKPISGFIQMTVDSSDSSGRTWAGSYTIVASDVPVDRFTWPITVTASVSGDTGSSVQNVNLFRTLRVDVATFSSSTYTTPKDSFVRGQTVFVKALVSLQDGRFVSSGTVTFRISGTGVATTPVPMTFSAPSVAWTGAYTLLTSDQTGSQTVTVSAADTQGSLGSGTHQISIGAPQGLTVSINSPTPNRVFNRGDTVTISALILLAGAPVTAASVTANTPTGGTITFTGGAGGVYSAQYTVLGTDPVGMWTITVRAIQGTASGSSQVAVTISASLDVVVSTWSSSSFTTPKDSFIRGQTVFVKAQITRHDGSVVSSGIVRFKITGTSIANSPITMTFSTSLNAWTGTYTLLQTDQTGNQIVMVTASDPNSNVGSGTHAVGIEVPVTSAQPLEAKITFDTQTQDIVVKAVCKPGCVSPLTVSVTSSTFRHGGGEDDEGEDDEGEDDNGSGALRTYTISDSAGHLLILHVFVKNHGHEVKAQLLSIQYGSSAPVTPSKNKISFEFSGGEHGKARNLEQQIHVDGVVNEEAHFQAKKNITTVHIERDGSHHDHGHGQGHFTMNGLWLLELVTANGSLDVDLTQHS